MFTGAVLTGGGSTRMGRDKATRVTTGGRPLAEHVARTLRDGGAAEVLAVGGDAAALAAMGLTSVPDRYPGEGPLGGILTAFAAAAHPLVVVVACDLPVLATDAIRAVVTGAERGEADVAMANGGQREPLCAAWWVPRCREALQEAFDSGERAVHRAVRRLRVQDISVPPATLRNVNTPDDLPVADRLPGPAGSAPR